MTTIEKLDSYSKALTRYVRMKTTFENEEKNGKHHRKPFTESEPLPMTFEIEAEHLEWAEKIRRKIIPSVAPVMKMPERKI